MDPDQAASTPPTEPGPPADPDAYVAPEGSATTTTAPAPRPDTADAYVGPSTAGSRRRSGGRSGRRSASEPGERRRGNTKWLWPMLGVLLVCCALSSCGALWGAGVLNGSAKTKAAFTAADVHWALAASELTKVNDTVDKFSKVDAKNVAGSLTKLATEGEKGVARAKDQLAQSKAALAEVPKSASKTAYVAAVGEADAALAQMQALFAYVKHLGKLYGLAASGKAKVVIGNANLSSAVRAANKGNYKDTKRYASRASDAYSAAANDFAAGNVLDKSAGFKQTMAYTAKVKEEADVLAQVADAGAKNQVTSYNSLAKKQADLQAQVNKMPQGAILENPKWANAALDALLGSIKKHITQAESLHAAALKALKAGK